MAADPIMPMVGDVDDELDALVQPLRSLHGRLTDQKIALADQIRLVDEKIKRVERTLRGLDPDAVPAPARTASPSKHKVAEPKKRVSDEALAKAREWLLNHTPDEEITQVQMRNALGYDSGITSIIMRTFHTEGLVRLARVQGNLKLYKLIADNDTEE